MATDKATDEEVRAAFERAGLKVPDPERVLRIGYSAREVAVLQKLRPTG